MSSRFVQRVSDTAPSPAVLIKFIEQAWIDRRVVPAVSHLERKSSTSWDTHHGKSMSGAGSTTRRRPRVSPGTHL